MILSSADKFFPDSTGIANKIESKLADKMSHTKLHSVDNGSDVDNGSTKKEIGKHNFPFRTIQKSYPKVYNSNRAVIKGASMPQKDSGNVSVRPRQSKQELLKAIRMKDKEIMETEKEIENLKRDLVVRTPPDIDNGSSSIESVSKRIYKENKAKAETSHAAILDVAKAMAATSLLETKEILLLQENARKFKSVWPLLLDDLRNRKLKDKEVEAILNEKLDRERQAWKEYVDQQERDTEPRKRIIENMQYFEEVFPNLRAAREVHETLRSDTVRTRNQQVDYYRYLRELQERKAERSAVLVGPRLQRPPASYYVDSNNRLHESDMRPPKLDWAEEERAVFMEKYLEAPKNFNYIASFLKGRSCGDCIYYYYLTKKTDNYKEMVAMRDGRRARAARIREAQLAANSDPATREEQLTQ